MPSFPQRKHCSTNVTVEEVMAMELPEFCLNLEVKMPKGVTTLSNVGDVGGEYEDPKSRFAMQES